MPEKQYFTGIDVINAPRIESLTVTEDGTYTPSSGVIGYNPVTVNVSRGLEYIEQVEYVQTSNSTTVGITIPVLLNDIIHLDMRILRINGDQCVIGNRNYNSEVYLNQSSLTTWGNGIDWTADMDMSPVTINERRIYKAGFHYDNSGSVRIMYYGDNPYPAYGNVYGVKVIRNGEEVMNIVPAKLHNAERGIMYDTINHKIYFSDTSTDFALPTTE